MEHNISKEQQKIIKNIPNKKENEIFVPLKDFKVNPIIEYPNYYISDYGRVWNEKTKKINLGSPDSNSEYLDVHITRDTPEGLKRKHFYIHHLVAYHFIPNPENKKEITHLGLIHDNRAIMLIWVSRKEKNKHLAQFKPKIEYDDEFEISNIPDKKENEIFFPFKDYNVDPMVFYEGYYISSKGRVWNTKTKNMMEGHALSTGYIEITLSKNNISKNFLLHRMVAFHFIPNPENKPQVNHLGTKYQNDVDHLEWATRQENIDHAAKNITKFHKISVHKLHPKTLKIVHTYDSLTLANKDKYYSQGIYDAIDNETLYKGFYWKYVVEKEDEKIIEGEIWYKTENSIYDEVKQFPGYQVSDQGRLRGKLGRIMKLNIVGKVEKITLYKGTKESKTPFLFHRLVLMACNVKNEENKPEVDHIDSNPLNNKLINLRWSTQAEQRENPETKKKIKEINKKRILTIKVTKGNDIKYYEGIKQFCKDIKISNGTVHKYAESCEEFNGCKFEIINP